jgi:hypothetical protein
VCSRCLDWATNNRRRLPPQVSEVQTKGTAVPGGLPVKAVQNSFQDLSYGSSL